MLQLKIPKIILSSIIGEKRRWGRPKIRWTSEVVEDLQVLNIKIWTKSSQKFEV